MNLYDIISRVFPYKHIRVANQAFDTGLRMANGEDPRAAWRQQAAAWRELGEEQLAKQTEAMIDLFTATVSGEPYSDDQIVLLARSFRHVQTTRNKKEQEFAQTMLSSGLFDVDPTVAMHLAARGISQQTIEENKVLVMTVLSQVSQTTARPDLDAIAEKINQLIAQV